MGVLKALVAEPPDNDANQIYRVWQQMLLAQMGVGGGIGGWVAQQADVVAVDLAGHFAEPNPPLIAQTSAVGDAPVNNALNNTPPAAPANDALIALATPNAPAFALPSVVPNGVPNSLPHASSVPADKPVLAAAALSAPASSLAQPKQAVLRFNLRIIAYQGWCIVADDAILCQDSRQAELWGKIATGLHSQSHLYTFPLIDNFGDFPPSYVTRMLSQRNAIACFNGFCQSLLMRTPRLGALTALPPCFAHEPIERLPQLSQMLQSTDAKRVLWNTLNETAQ